MNVLRMPWFLLDRGLGTYINFSLVFSYGPQTISHFIISDQLLNVISKQRSRTEAIRIQFEQTKTGNDIVTRCVLVRVGAGQRKQHLQLLYVY